ncbi:MAG: hypothetical protein HKN94_04645 [Acidimicrobiales bacterium]|nr:hypothetical protein [Acidimicrobiales bacterium]
MKRFIAMTTVAATISLLLSANPLSASHQQRSWFHVTQGSFETLPGGEELGYDVQGRAKMVRTGHGDAGATLVVVRVRGLDPRTTYPTHVHNKPCSATPPGGGHYQNVIGGPVDDVNEMWPAITTNKRGKGTSFAMHDAQARLDAQSIVVHYPLDTSIRLACLDLR